LYRIARQKEFIIGISDALRISTSDQSVIGYCVNMLPVRISIHQGMKAVDFVRETRSRILEVLSHEQVPFADLIYQIDLRRDPGRSPLFDATFNLNRTYHRTELFGVSANLLDMPIQASQFDLNFDVVDRGEILMAQLTYNTDIFTSEYVQWILSQW